MPRPARPLATWLAVFALLVQSLAFALHGPLRVLAGADGGLVICTAEGLKRIGASEPDRPPRPAEHACSACVTLASAAIPPAAAPATAIAYAAAGTMTPAFREALPARSTIVAAQPRAPPFRV